MTVGVVGAFVVDGPAAATEGEGALLGTGATAGWAQAAANKAAAIVENEYLATTSPPLKSLRRRSV